jgi:hypothetical protein
MDGCALFFSFCRASFALCPMDLPPFSGLLPRSSVVFKGVFALRPQVACLSFGSPPAHATCLVQSFDVAATAFPRYKIRHGCGADFDRHGLGAATLAVESLAVNQTSPKCGATASSVLCCSA